MMLFRKIEAQIEDLSSVQDVLSEDIIKNAAEIEILEREKAKYDEIIRGEITPQIEKLRDCLGEYTQALSQSKANEMIKGFRNILSRQLGVAVNEDENLHEQKLCPVHPEIVYPFELLYDKSVFLAVNKVIHGIILIVRRQEQELEKVKLLLRKAYIAKSQVHKGYGALLFMIKAVIVIIIPGQIEKIRS